MSSDISILLTLSGADRPGVTAVLFNALAAHDVVVLDVEQLVARGHLVLAVLIDPGSADPAHVEVAARRECERLGMSVTVTIGSAEIGRQRRDRIDVTVMGRPLVPSVISALASDIAGHGGNIDRIRRIAHYPVTAITFECSGAEPEPLRRALSLTASELSVDVSVRPAGLASRGQHLVVMDVDSTLIKDEVIELLAAHAGVEDDVRRVTSEAMNGELDFAESLRARVALLEGVPETALSAVLDAVTLTPGARTLCRTLGRLGYHVALVSGGFTQVVEPIARDLGIDHVRANELEIREGRLTGRVVGAIIDRAGKRAALEEFAAEHGVPLSRTVAIGDGANDIDMLSAAGLGVAFNAKPALRAAADATLNVPYLDSVLYLLGITREEIEAADEADGIIAAVPVD